MMHFRLIFPQVVLLGALHMSSVCSASQMRMACYPDFAPYASTHADGSGEGVIIDLWHLWAKKTGTKITFVPMTLPEGIDAVAEGKVDVHCGNFYSDERAARLSYSDTLLRTEGVLFVKKPSTAKSIADVKTTIAVVRGDYAVGFLSKHFPSVKLQTFPDYRSLLAAVNEKGTTAFIYDSPRRFPGYADPAPFDGYRRLQVLYSERIRAAVKRGNVEMIERINNGLSKITDEELWEIASDWKFYSKDNKMLIATSTVAGMSLLVLIFTIIYIRKLRSRLKRVTSPEGEWPRLIQGGETDLVEFKSSLRWDLKEQRVNKALEQVIAKAISAFLNAQGGHLLIGVDDDGRVLGLEKDYQTFSKKQNADGFVLGLSAVINNLIGKKYHRFITASIVAVEGQEICIVAVRPADGPAFLNLGNKEEFYIRAQASSQPLGLRETHEYIVSKWSKRAS